MTRNILLLGRKGVIVENARKQINNPDVEIFAGTNIQDVREVFARTRIDHVFSGAGIDLKDRLEIIKEIFERSDTTCVHLKDAASGPQGFLGFVKAVMDGVEAGAKDHEEAHE